MTKKTSEKSLAAAQADEPMVSVWFDLPGVVMIGDYRPRKLYDVPAGEAARLIKVKGFIDHSVMPLVDKNDLQITEG